MLHPPELEQPAPTPMPRPGLLKGLFQGPAMLDSPALPDYSSAMWIMLSLATDSRPRAQNGVAPVVETRPKVERPRLYKVVLVNDDFTPREFVVIVLRRVFNMGPERAWAIMSTAHKRGACVVAVFTRDVAETKATEANDAGRAAGYPLLFTTEPEE